MSSTVLFVCVHNAGRSVMAEALFNAHPPPGFSAVSAGTEPGGSPHAEVVAAMSEIGIDISVHRGRLLTDEMITGAMRVVTMGCAVDEAACPAIRLAGVDDWGLSDPKGRPIDEVRAVRDEIALRVTGLVRSLRKPD